MYSLNDFLKSSPKEICSKLDEFRNANLGKVCISKGMRNTCSIISKDNPSIDCTVVKIAIIDSSIKRMIITFQTVDGGSVIFPISSWILDNFPFILFDDMDSAKLYMLLNNIEVEDV